MGKPETTETQWVDKHNRMVVTSRGHEHEGVKHAKSFLEKINAPNAIFEKVGPLVNDHLAHIQASTPRSVRRLANRLQPATIEELVVIIEADHGGRPPLSKELPIEAIELLKKAKELNVQDKVIKPLLTGKHLINDFGLKPGRNFGTILKKAFEDQLDGIFVNEEEALQYASSLISQLTE